MGGARSSAAEQCRHMLRFLVLEFDSEEELDAGKARPQVKLDNIAEAENAPVETAVSTRVR